jgi:hypothetical protein
MDSFFLLFFSLFLYPAISSFMKPSLELWSFEFPDVTGLDFFQQNPIDGGCTAPSICTYHDVIRVILFIASYVRQRSQYTII